MTASFVVGQQVDIKFTGRNGTKIIAQGIVTKVLKNWVEVATPKYARPVRYRIGEHLTGRRITGGLAEYLNDFIDV